MIGSPQAYLLRLPYRIGTEPAGEWGGTLDRVLLRIEARDGVIGWGEAFGYRSAPATLAALREIVIPLALELDDIDPATANRRLQRACHQGGRAGPLLHAIAAVDIALWDIAAKRRGEPLYALLGGGRRPTLPAYSSLLHHGDRDAVADACRGGVEAGFTAVKLHDIERDSVRAAREAVGVKLMVDANCTWNADQAAREIAALREFEPHWTEEPMKGFPPEDFDTLARLMRAAGAPLAAGENSATPSDYQAMMEGVGLVWQT